MNSISTLTWVLLILAVVVIGGVLLFNFLQERKSSPKVKVTAAAAVPVPTGLATPKAPASESLDAAIERDLTDTHSHFVDNQIEQGSHAEPSIGVLTQYHGDSVDMDNKVSHAIGASAEKQVLNPLNGQSATVEAPMEAAALSNVASSVLSNEFDYLIEFALPSLQSGERLLSMTAAHRRAGGKPVSFDGLLSNGQWVVLQAGELYAALRAGLLLANRHGPLNAMEFSDFGNFAQELAKQLDCEVNLADMPRVLSRARDVDRQCAELDAQLGISIHTATVISPAMLAAATSEQGLTERGGSRFAKLDDKGGTLFTVSFGEQGDKLAMLLDVPRAPAQLRPWQQMVQCAQALAKTLDGQLVDDAGKPLPDGLWGQIEEQLRQRYWALEAAGIEPGSARALRLFN
jgi:ZipA, C-terminal FtsZ-binding domain